MIRGINHVGIVVRNIDEVVTFLTETFMAKAISRTEFTELKQISALVQIGGSFFELMEPTAADGVVGKFLETKGGGLHHISLLCDDVTDFCEKFEAKGFQVIAKMCEGPFKVAFLHPKNTKGILFELTEKPSYSISK